MKKKRMRLLAVFLTTFMLMLIGRLAYIQLVSTESFSKHDVNLLEASVNQRSQILKIDDGRGKFYDRNGEPLAHEEIPTLVLFPFLKKMTWPIEEVASIIGKSEAELKRAIEQADEPFVFGGDEPIELTSSQSKAINELKIPGVFAVNEKLYPDQTPAAQLIGTTNISDAEKKKRYPDMNLSPETKIGNTGLQRTFDEFLLSAGESKLVFHVDASGGPMFGVDVKYVEPANPLYPVKVVTTIDKEIQEKAEKLVDERGIKKGGLVLIDIEKSEIVAMVSRPALNIKDPNGEGAVNMMLTQKTPGSVFKTVTAAAAIDYEAASPTRTFNCNLTIDGKTDKQRELGMLNFENSFAQSCNRTFAELSQEIAEKDPEFLDKYAKMLGLVGESGWQGDVYHTEVTQLHHEQTGKVWHDDDLKKDPKMIAKTAIGQQDVQTTPLAIANMMATIARGGKKEQVKAVSKVEFNNGTTVVDFPNQSIGGETLSPYTTMKMQHLLRKVVTEEKGTGASLRDLPVEVAGKSGTAQTNIEKGQLNKWFAGYFPYKDPKYALVTVSFETKENSSSMTPLFSDIVKVLYSKDQDKNEN
ncbi:peptidoglycan D,D-transpeptidase FtsI family protein [Peribacillus frigoritolerans]|uniref:peptidoglycan D,D-transpeptidase FtsI family protein n=1 Tax=Peribacillus frigoritolerans TaxID=450367 RepID=UPI00315D02CF